MKQYFSQHEIFCLIGEKDWQDVFPVRANSTSHVAAQMGTLMMPLLHQLVDIGFGNAVLPLARMETIFTH